MREERFAVGVSFHTYSQLVLFPWGFERDITPDVKKPQWGWYATGPGVGVQLTQGDHQGRLVIPCDHRLQGDDPNRAGASRAGHLELK